MFFAYESPFFPPLLNVAGIKNQTEKYFFKGFTESVWIIYFLE